MHFVEGILIALEALWANKLRTVLTLLGNIVGVMSVIAVVSIIDGMNSYIRNEVAHEGSGVFRVQRVNELDILSDYDKFMRSLHNRVLQLPDETVVVPGHGDLTTIGEERQSNPFLRPGGSIRLRP